MKNSKLPESLSDRIYEIKTSDDNITKIVSYFPLSENQKKQITQLLGDAFISGTFHSIFSDAISDEEWEKSKSQIKKKFNDELFDIDKL